MASVVRLLSALGFVAVVGLSLPAKAEDFKFPGTFSANAGLVTEYRFRGLDQSSQKPAIQGGIDWSMETGLNDTSVYLGTWGSNVDFGDGDKASAEIDYYGGITGSFMNVGRACRSAPTTPTRRTSSVVAVTATGSPPMCPTPFRSRFWRASRWTPPSAAR